MFFSLQSLSYSQLSPDRKYSFECSNGSKINFYPKIPEENSFCIISYFSCLFSFYSPAGLENWLSAYYSFLIKLMSQLKYFVLELPGPWEEGQSGRERTGLFH